MRLSNTSQRFLVAGLLVVGRYCPSALAQWRVIGIDDANWAAPAIAIDASGAVHIVMVNNTGNPDPPTTFRYRIWNGALSEPIDHSEIDVCIDGHAADWCPLHEALHVSFHDACAARHSGNLMLGTAFPNEGWRSYETLVEGPFGYSTSIECAPDGYAHISYRGETTGGLYYWTDDPSLTEATGNVLRTECREGPGRYSSIRVDSQRRPHIACSSWGTDCENLYYAHWNGSAWIIESNSQPGQLCTPSKTFRHVAMALDNSDRPHVIYHDAGSLRTRYAFQGNSEAWCCQDILEPESRYTNIDLDGTGIPIVAIDETNELYRRAGNGCPYTWEKLPDLPEGFDFGGSRRYFQIAPDGSLYVAGRDSAGISLAVLGSLHVTVDGECPGRAEVTVRGASAGGQVAIIYGTREGRYAIRGPVCNATLIDISRPFLPGAPILITADGSGTARVYRQVPEGLCGRLLIQAVDVETCRVSALVRF